MYWYYIEIIWIYVHKEYVSVVVFSSAVFVEFWYQVNSDLIKWIAFTPITWKRLCSFGVITYFIQFFSETIWSYKPCFSESFRLQTRFNCYITTQLISFSMSEFSYLETFKELPYFTLAALFMCLSSSHFLFSLISCKICDDIPLSFLLVICVFSVFCPSTLKITSFWYLKI